MSRPYVLANPRRSAPEKAQERAAHRLMEALGFTAWRLSQARATNQTPGLCDIIFTHPERGLLVAYEAKSPNGRQSPAQREFQRHVVAAGIPYVVGTVDALVEWCRSKRLVG